MIIDETLFPQDALDRLRVLAEGYDGEHGHVDNERIAEAGNAEQLVVYAQAVKEGCCGTADEVFTSTNGKKYWIGCNFGH